MMFLPVRREVFAFWLFRDAIRKHHSIVAKKASDVVSRAKTSSPRAGEAKIIPYSHLIITHQTLHPSGYLTLKKYRLE